MAIAVTHLDHDNTTTGGSPWTTKSFTFQNNRLYLLSLFSAFDETDFSAVSGGGITWVKITAASALNAGPSNFFGGALFRGLVTSGATSGTLSVTTDVFGTGAISIDEVTGMDTTGTNGSGAIVQGGVAVSDSGAATSLAATLSAFGDSGNVSYAYAGKNAGLTAFTPDASNGGYAETLDFTDAGSNFRMQNQWNTGSDTSVGVSWTTGAAAIVGAVEIKIADPIVDVPPNRLMKRIGAGRRAGN